MTVQCAEKDNAPQHIAVIMDGNNRWARRQGLTGTAGHRAGAEAARDIITACINRRIKYLTLFAFSSENWLRPNKEVKGLMALFLAVLKRNEVQQMHARNVRVQFIGNRDRIAGIVEMTVPGTDHLAQIVRPLPPGPVSEHWPCMPCCSRNRRLRKCIGRGLTSPRVPSR